MVGVRLENPKPLSHFPFQFPQTLHPQGLSFQPPADLSTLPHLPGAFQGGFPLTPGSWAQQGLTSPGQGHRGSYLGHIPSPSPTRTRAHRVHTKHSFTTRLSLHSPRGAEEGAPAWESRPSDCAPSPSSPSSETLCNPLPAWTRGVLQVPLSRRG